MKLVFLGTASCFPTPTRGVSCTALQNDDGSVWIFDCGEGSQIQLQKSTLKAGKVSKIFITHLHGDHLYGLPGLLCTLGNGLDPSKVGTAAVEVIGPVGLRKFIAVTLGLSRSPLAYKLDVTEIEPLDWQYPEDWSQWEVEQELTGAPLPQERTYRRVSADEKTGAWSVLAEGGVEVQAVGLAHRIPSFGFLISEAPSPGKLDAGKLLEVGIKPGPIYGKLKAGLSVDWEGKTLCPEDFLGAEIPGRRLAILGDTKDSSRLSALVSQKGQGIDLICHEATMEEANLEKALTFGHSTPSMAVKIAFDCEASHLVIFHLSARYKPVSLCSAEDPESANIIEREAKEEMSRLGISDLRLTVAEDFSEVVIPKKNR